MERIRACSQSVKRQKHEKSEMCIKSGVARDGVCLSSWWSVDGIWTWTLISSTVSFVFSFLLRVTTCILVK